MHQHRTHVMSLSTLDVLKPLVLHISLTGCISYETPSKDQQRKCCASDSAHNNSKLHVLCVTIRQSFFSSTFFFFFLTAQCRSTTVTLFPQPPSGRCERRRSEGRERIKRRRRTQNGKLQVLAHLLERWGGVSWLCRGNEKIIIAPQILNNMLNVCIR